MNPRIHFTDSGMSYARVEHTISGELLSAEVLGLMRIESRRAGKQRALILALRMCLQLGKRPVLMTADQAESARLIGLHLPGVLCEVVGTTALRLHLPKRRRQWF